MLRLVIYAIIIFLVYKMAKSFLVIVKKIDRSPPGGAIDELVQDPMCKTYIPPRGAIRKVVRGQEHFFCSKECAEKYESGEDESSA